MYCLVAIHPNPVALGEATAGDARPALAEASDADNGASEGEAPRKRTMRTFDRDLVISRLQNPFKDKDVPEVYHPPQLLLLDRNANQPNPTHQSCAHLAFTEGTCALTAMHRTLLFAGYLLARQTAPFAS